MKLFIKLLLIASLGVASLAASNTYMTSVDNLAVGHVLASEVRVAELVVKGDTLATEVTTFPAGTALGPTHIATLRSTHLVDPDLDVTTLGSPEEAAARLASLDHDLIAEVICYTEPGADSGNTTAVAVADLQPGQVLGMDAEVLWTEQDGDDLYRHTRTIVPAGTVVSSAVIERLRTGIDEELEATLKAAGIEEVVIGEIRSDGLGDSLRTRLEEAGVDTDTLAIIDRGGVDHVRVNDFRFAQWEWKWWFVIGCVGMLAAALLARKAAPKGGASEEAGYTYESTSQHLKEMLEMLETAWADAQAASPGEARCRVIVHHLDQVRAGPQFEVNEGLGAFKTRGGYAQYARIVDSFAYGERQVHRAWSAAVDEIEDEAMLSLQRAIGTLRETVAQL
ncbi:MAG: hypothetical protein KDA21_09835 [Phycisphaerales bacterium]|nr:hypothetical protein [Phycisphaerales bacterium]